MERKNKILIIISYCLTLINILLAFWLNIKSKTLYEITEEDSQLQYEYLTEILIISFFKLLITTCIFDIGYFLVNLFFTYCFCKFEEDENIKIPINQGNKFSNLVIEFLFFFLIKGIALGFSCFYSIEIIEETKRITNDYSNPQTKEQLELLKSIKNHTYFMKWIILITMIYLLFIYLTKFISYICQSDDNKINKENKSKEIKVNDYIDERSLSLEYFNTINDSVIDDSKIEKSRDSSKYELIN